MALTCWEPSPIPATISPTPRSHRSGHPFRQASVRFPGWGWGAMALLWGLLTPPTAPCLSGRAQPRLTSTPGSGGRQESCSQVLGGCQGGGQACWLPTRCPEGGPAQKPSACSRHSAYPPPLLPGGGSVPFSTGASAGSVWHAAIQCTHMHVRVALARVSGGTALTHTQEHSDLVTLGLSHRDGMLGPTRLPTLTSPTRSLAVEGPRGLQAPGRCGPGHMF